MLCSVKKSRDREARGVWRCGLVEGRDLQDIQLLENMKASSEPKNYQEEAMVVVTRAQAHRQLEEELLRREKEMLAGAKPNPVETKQGVSEAETDYTVGASRGS